MQKSFKKRLSVKYKISKKRKNDKNKVKKRIKIVIHPLTIVFALLSAVLGVFWLFLMYFSCLILHEFSHYLVAKKLGYYCDKMMIYPTGVLLDGNTDEFAFSDEILISLAGPVCNIFISIFCVFLWWIWPELYNFSADFLVVNLSIAFFNLLPIFPLDGGRVLLAVFSRHMSRKNACKISKIITMCFALLLFVIFIISIFVSINFQIGIMAIVIFGTVVGEDKQAVYKRIVKSDIKKRKLSHGVKVNTLMFDKDVNLARVISKIDNFAFYTIKIVDDNFRICATMSETQIFDYAQKLGLTTKLGDLV